MKLNAGRIKYEMGKRGWDVEDLSTALGRVRTYGYYLLSGNPNLRFSTLEEIAKVLDLNPKDLIE